MPQDPDNLTDSDEGYEIEFREVSGCKVTACCPICHRAQVFGYTYHAAMHDLLAHMNEFHTREEDVTVPIGKSGEA